MPLHPLGICRSRDQKRVPETVAAGSAVARWTREDELACAWLDAANNVAQPLEHAAAVDAIHRRVCVLPMRFGVVASGEADIRSTLQARRQELVDRLDYLDGASEMALRIAAPRPLAMATAPRPADSASLSYLDRRRAQYEQQDQADVISRAVEGRYLELLRGLFRDWRRLPSAALNPVRLAFLVAREQIDAFRSRIEKGTGQHGEEGCFVLGPWPPYSFV
jgi:hypothetical protein